jgi:hypothetical protein
MASANLRRYNRRYHLGSENRDYTLFFTEGAFGERTLRYLFTPTPSLPLNGEGGFGGFTRFLHRQ